MILSDFSRTNEFWTGKRRIKKTRSLSLYLYVYEFSAYINKWSSPNLIEPNSWMVYVSQKF